MNKKILALASLCFGAVCIAWFALQNAPESSTRAGSPHAATVQSTPQAGATVAASAQPLAAVSEEQKSDAMAEVSESLRQEFGSQINEPKVQVRALEKMINFLMKLYGDQWREQMEVLIRLTFPELADSLLKRFENLMTYNDWARDQKYALANMSEQERRQFMWDKRRELFGEDAEAIWQGALRNERVQDTLAAINSNTAMPLDRKIDYYVNQLREIYQADAPAVLANRHQEVMDHFLLVDTVQADLHQMPTDTRRQHLRQLRQAVGLDEAALQRWDGLDSERDSRWATGKSYMQARSGLQAKFQGAELEAKLRELQNQTFGAEADIIRNEEASGYFRYEGQQQFGLN